MIIFFDNLMKINCDISSFTYNTCKFYLYKYVYNILYIKYYIIISLKTKYIIKIIICILYIK